VGRLFDRLTGVWERVRPALLKSKPVGTQIAIAALLPQLTQRKRKLFSKSYLKSQLFFRLNPYRQNLPPRSNDLDRQQQHVEVSEQNRTNWVGLRA